MRHLSRTVPAVALLTLVASCAWGLVTATWTDAAGPQSVNLAAVTNPNWAHDLTNQEEQYVWQGGLWVTMGSSSAIQLSVSGNYMSGGKVWKQLRLGLYFQNQIPSSPNKISKVFVDIVSSNGKIYNLYGLPATWNWTNTTSLAGEFSASGSTYYIQPAGAMIVTGLKFLSIVDPVTGNGSATFTVRPNCVP